MLARNKELAPTPHQVETLPPLAHVFGASRRCSACGVAKLFVETMGPREFGRCGPNVQLNPDADRMHAQLAQLDQETRTRVQEIVNDVGGFVEEHREAFGSPERMRELLADRLAELKGIGAEKRQREIDRGVALIDKLYPVAPK